MATGVTTIECRALFDHWRAVIMGNLGREAALPLNVAGYFHRAGPPSDPGSGGPALPLGEVRRALLAVIDRAPLTSEERTVIELYYGLHGLPLPFASSSKPDIAAGRDESTVRAVKRAALARLAPHVTPRPVAATPTRSIRNPVLEPWFRSRLRSHEARRAVLARAYVRAVSQCDGPYAGPTLDALEVWYRNSGYADPGLVIGGTGAGTAVVTGAGSPERRRPRPNRNAQARAGALMELAVYDELVLRAPPNAAPPPLQVATDLGPVPAAGDPGGGRPLEIVTHRDLIVLLEGDPSPRGLLRAAATLQDRALHGEDVSGQLGLLLRHLRPRVARLGPWELERIAVSISYVASAHRNPFLGLEWLGYQLAHLGVTDRTFTVLVNTSVAASRAGHLDLAHQANQLSLKLRRRWPMPPTAIPLVERVEAHQQWLVAESVRLEHLAHSYERRGAAAQARATLVDSVTMALESATMAETVLTDHAAYPSRQVPDKVGRHGGDLTWPWLLGALLRVVEPLVVLDQSPGHARSASQNHRQFIRSRAHRVIRLLDRFEGDLDSPRFVQWHHLIATEADRLAAT